MLIEERTGRLAAARPDELIRLADDLLDVHGEPTVVTAPEVALVAFDVREPVRRERFRAGDVLVTHADVAFGEHEGWAMRLGEDRAATLAAAICAAVGDHGLAGADRVDELCATVAERTERARWGGVFAASYELAEQTAALITDRLGVATG